MKVLSYQSIYIMVYFNNGQIREDNGRSRYHIVNYVLSCMCLSTNQAIELAARPWECALSAKMELL